MKNNNEAKQQPELQQTNFRPWINQIINIKRLWCNRVSDAVLILFLWKKNKNLQNLWHIPDGSGTTVLGNNPENPAAELGHLSKSQKTLGEGWNKQLLLK